LPSDERHCPSSGRRALLLGVMLAAAAPAAAQTARPTLPGAVQPGRETQPLPQLPWENEFDFSIQQPGRSPVPRAAEELVFTLHGINVVGATVYTAEDLRFTPTSSSTTSSLPISRTSPTQSRTSTTRTAMP